MLLAISFLVLVHLLDKVHKVGARAAVPLAAPYSVQLVWEGHGVRDPGGEQGRQFNAVNAESHILEFFHRFCTVFCIA